MKLIRFETKDRRNRIGIFWDDKTVIDIIAAGEALPKPKFESVKTTLDIIAMGEKGIITLKNFLNELKEMKEKNHEIFEEIQNDTFYSLIEVKLLAPIDNPPKIICLGRNYIEHAKEGGAEAPKYPMIWGKFNSAIIGHQSPIILPRISEKVDVEIELVAVLGKKGKHIPEDEALDYVFGYMIGNDVSARDFQYLDKQFTRSKTMDTFAPLGPWIVTKDEIPDPQNLILELKVNEKTWQKSNTKNMSFSVANIISYLSDSFTFEAGDLIFTGTPEGVGHYQNPPKYLKEGDKVHLSIEKIGVLENPVIMEK